MCMIRDGDMRRVMDHEGISLNTKSRQRNAFFIQKHYLRDVGNHMMEFGAEAPSDHEAGWSTRHFRRPGDRFSRRAISAVSLPSFPSNIGTWLAIIDLIRSE